jgi:voltage-gated potassium channel Kch
MASDKLDTLKAIWTDGFPSAKPRRHSLIEKLLCTFAICACLVSLSNLKAIFPSTIARSRSFMDVYVLLWATAISILLFVEGLPALLAVVVAAYRIFDIASYRVFFLLVKSQKSPWSEAVLRRSLVIAVVNFYEILTAFAILYLHCGCIVLSGSQDPISRAGVALYFSMVTMVTVGYGDFVPNTSAGRVLVGLQLTTTIIFVLFLLPALVSVFSTSLRRTQEKD